MLPSGYPFKPPNIYFLNENGRFEIRKKICLSFSAYHPEDTKIAEIAQDEYEHSKELKKAMMMVA